MVESEVTIAFIRNARLQSCGFFLESNETHQNVLITSTQSQTHDFMLWLFIPDYAKAKRKGVVLVVYLCIYLSTVVPKLF